MDYGELGRVMLMFVQTVCLLLALKKQEEILQLLRKCEGAKAVPDDRKRPRSE